MSIVETYAETPAASTTALKVNDFIFGSLYICGWQARRLVAKFK